MEENKNRDDLFRTIEKTEDDFEKKITQISAGALALSITFIDKIVDLSTAKYFFILIIGWVLLVLTLSINLISILISREFNLKSVDEYDDYEKKIISDKELIQNIKNRNKTIRKLDIISLVKLLLGIFLIVLFSSLNINNKSKLNMRNKDIIERGRTMRKPQVNPQTSNSENQTTYNNSNMNQTQTDSSNNNNE